MISDVMSVLLGGTICFVINDYLPPFNSCTVWHV